MPGTPTPSPPRGGGSRSTVAALMLGILALRPDGLTRGREIPWPGRRRSHVADEPAAAESADRGPS